jgi:predicted nuclease of predicted toxin-antitoxin system
MSLSIVVDMNLSPEWIPLLSAEGWPTIHWSQVGNARAHDSTIMQWARGNAHTVFTHDLDFGTTLALTHATGPSVIQVRGKKVLPEDIGGAVITATK